MEEEKTDKQISDYKKKRHITKSTKDITTAASSKIVNRIDLNVVRWGQDGWILDYLNEHIFKGLMRDFHLEIENQEEADYISPETLFHFYIRGIKDGLLSTPMVSVDLKEAKEFLQKPISERNLFRAIEKVGNKWFKGGFVLPKIVDLDTKETFAYCLPQDDTIFRYIPVERERTKGLKTVKHYEYYLMLTPLGIYMILTASAFYNTEFLSKALYKLDDGCNDFYRSIAGFWKIGAVKISYNKTRDRMGIRPHVNPSVERQNVEHKLNRLKGEKIIDDWKIVKGGKRYGKNQEIVYLIILNQQNYKRYKRRYAGEKYRKKALLRHWPIFVDLEEENQDES